MWPKVQIKNIYEKQLLSILKKNTHPSAYSHNTCVQNNFTCNHQYDESFSYAHDSKFNHVNKHKKKHFLVINNYH
jgi:hypothetical protein